VDAWLDLQLRHAAVRWARALVQLLLLLCGPVGELVHAHLPQLRLVRVMRKYAVQLRAEERFTVHILRGVVFLTKVARVVCEGVRGAQLVRLRALRRGDGGAQNSGNSLAR